MKADGTERRQLSHPFALEPDTCDGQCDNGHQAFDRQPTWTPDGKIAYIRMVYSGDESPHVGERGTSVQRRRPRGRRRVDPLLPRAEGERPDLRRSSGRCPRSIRSRSSATSPTRTSRSATWARRSTSCRRSGSSTSTPRRSARSSRTRHCPRRPHGPLVDFAGRELESFATGLEKPQSASRPMATRSCGPAARVDREQRRHCGLVAHRLDGSGRRRPRRRPARDAVPRPAKLIRLPSLPGYRGNYDIQSQDLPVIYIPGFLGSEIQCDGSNVWMPALPPIVMQPIRLSADGRSNQTCFSAGATGKMVDSFLAKDVYGHADDWLDEDGPARWPRELWLGLAQGASGQPRRARCQDRGAAGGEQARRQAGRQARHADRPLLRRRPDAACSSTTSTARARSRGC